MVLTPSAVMSRYPSTTRRPVLVWLTYCPMARVVSEATATADVNVALL